MAQEQHANNNTTPGELAAETKERGGCFDFMKKKGEKTRDDNDEGVVVTGQSTGDHHDKQHTLGEELHRTRSHSSSSSEEEEVEEEGGERKKKKKKRETIKEKLSGNADTYCVDHPMEEEQPAAETEEKKGFMEKIKEKLPGHHHNSHGADEEAKAGAQTHHDDPSPPSTYADDRAKEKKGILDKIKEKLPGGNNKADLKKD